ncbi:hypothetical protein [Acinetobacter sp. SFB]|uniref:hypothetical protein n=1 Tax=Acinetobacter sp. SFB TaxID=1805634 RepID=UPI000A442BD2|nr:hypothetical protein [Acinetobacter sp. SFB]
MSSILIWVSLVAVIKLITESLSPISAIALIYHGYFRVAWTAAFQHMSKAYLWGGGALFVASEILFCFRLLCHKTMIRC